MSTWQEEAVGIVPWIGAQIVNDNGDVGIQVEEPNSEGWFNVMRIPAQWDLVGFCVARALPGEDPPFIGSVPNLEDPDTLAAFDRRLALRLGAPEDAVREGVVFFQEGSTWICAAGGYLGETRAGHNVARLRWYHDAGWLDGATDTLLARVRAWKSVP